MDLLLVKNVTEQVLSCVKNVMEQASVASAPNVTEQVPLFAANAMETESIKAIRVFIAKVEASVSVHHAMVRVEKDNESANQRV